MNTTFILNHQIHNSQNLDKLPAILLIPGFTGTLEVWNLTIQTLIDKKLPNPIIAIDNLGAGKNPDIEKLEFTTTLMAEFILDLIKHLNLPKIILIGHSLGGAIAQAITISQPKLVEQLFLVSSFAKLDNVACNFLSSRVDLAKVNTDKTLIAKAVIPSLFANQFLSNQQNINFAITRFLSNPQTVTGMYAQFCACVTHNLLDEIKQINTKTIIISGEDDILVNKKHSLTLQRNITSSDLITIPSCGHMVPIEKAQELSQIILDNF